MTASVWRRCKGCVAAQARGHSQPKSVTLERLATAETEVQRLNSVVLQLRRAASKRQIECCCEALGGGTTCTVCKLAEVRSQLQDSVTALDQAQSFLALGPWRLFGRAIWTPVWDSIRRRFRRETP